MDIDQKILFTDYQFGSELTIGCAISDDVWVNDSNFIDWFKVQ